MIYINVEFGGHGLPQEGFFCISKCRVKDTQAVPHL